MVPCPAATKAMALDLTSCGRDPSALLQTLHWALTLRSQARPHN